MISKTRIAEIVLELDASGDLCAMRIVELSDKQREDKSIDVNIKEIKPYLLPFLKQEKNRYFIARDLNLYIFGRKNILKSKRLKEKSKELKNNIHWIRGCNDLLCSIFGMPCSRNRFLTKKCLDLWTCKKHKDKVG